MPKKTSQLSTAQQQQLIDRFFQVVGDLYGKNESRQFLHDFLTQSERITFAKRLAIALELDAGKSYEEIRKGFGVSTATISTVADLMKQPGMKMGIAKVKTEAWADSWAEKLLKIVGE